MLLVIIGSNCHIPPHCGYCRSPGEATRVRDHKNKTKSQQHYNHFSQTASSHHSCAHSLGSHHITLARGRRSRVKQAAQKADLGQFPSRALSLAHLATHRYFLHISAEVAGTAHKAETQFIQP